MILDDWLADKAFDPRYGVRPWNRLICEQIAADLTDRIIRGENGSDQQAKAVMAHGGGNLTVLPST